MDNKMTRRTYLKTLTLGVAAVGLGGLGLAACKSGGKELDCSNATGLSDMDAMLRKTLVYVDKSPNAEKSCANCVQFVAAAADQCGTCKLVKGPINPAGYCNSWAAKS